MSGHSGDQFWLHAVSTSSRSKYFCGSLWVVVPTAACLWNVRANKTQFTCPGTWSWNWTNAKFEVPAALCYLITRCLRCWSQSWTKRWWVADWLACLFHRTTFCRLLHECCSGQDSFDTEVSSVASFGFYCFIGFTSVVLTAFANWPSWTKCVFWCFVENHKGNIRLAWPYYVISKFELHNSSADHYSLLP